MPITYSPEARSDLEAIRSYIADRDPAAARRIALRLLAACDSLEHLPERGRAGLVSGTRELSIITPYVIVYRTTQGSVEIVRIWHRLRDRNR